MSNYVQSTNFATKDALPSGDPLKIVKGTEINTEFNNIAVAVATKADLNSPTLVSPALGTPSSGNLVNTVGLPIVAGTTGTLSVARGGTGVTTSTGSGSVVLSASPTFTGTPAAPTASAGSNSTQIATTAYADAAIAAAKQALYPVGSIYINATNATNPGTLLGFGTWVAFGAGRVLLSSGTLADNTFTAGQAGGSYDATLPSHTHTINDGGHSHSLATEFGTASGPSNAGDIGGTTAQSATGGQSTILDRTTSATTGITGTNSAGSSATNANLQPYIVVVMWQRTA
jgi:hypothetical protein